jgi:hypothetical protein
VTHSGVWDTKVALAEIFLGRRLFLWVIHFYSALSGEGLLSRSNTSQKNAISISYLEKMANIFIGLRMPS